jgi:copper chaperone NosL
VRLPAVALALFFAAGCANRPLEPEPVPVDQVTCARCGMLVSSERQSAQWVASGEETRFYDDIGCLAADGRARSGRNVRFVHADAGWLPVERAYFGRPRDVSTPMGYGFLAFPDRRLAESRDSEGRAFTWAEVESELARKR